MATDGCKTCGTACFGPICAACKGEPGFKSLTTTGRTSSKHPNIANGPRADTSRRVRLEEPHFRALVRGGKVRVGDVEIILADIGFGVMRAAFADAEAGVDTCKDYEGNT